MQVVQCRVWSNDITNLVIKQKNFEKRLLNSTGLFIDWNIQAEIFFWYFQVDNKGILGRKGLKSNNWFICLRQSNLPYNQSWVLINLSQRSHFIKHQKTFFFLMFSVSIKWEHCSVMGFSDLLWVSILLLQNAKTYRTVKV